MRSRPHLLKGGNILTNIQKETVRYLRGEGLGYKAIASRLDLSADAVKGFCKRNGLNGLAVENSDTVCRHCSKPLDKTGSRQRKFCSDPCRSAWWSSHTYLYKHKKENSSVCVFCGRVFNSFQSKGRKYCGRSCYVAARFGGEKP